MNKHRIQPDGKVRDGDNWQKGVPIDTYMKSMLRHVLDVWLEHRGYNSRDGIIDALCGVIFNAQGYLFELLKEDEYGVLLSDEELDIEENKYRTSKWSKRLIKDSLMK
jgi:hypothetical protein